MIWSAITTSPTFRCGDSAPPRPMEITPRDIAMQGIQLRGQAVAIAAARHRDHTGDADDLGFRWSGR